MKKTNQPKIKHALSNKIKSYVMVRENGYLIKKRSDWAEILYHRAK